MKVKQIMLSYNNKYGMPYKEVKQNKQIKIHLYLKTFVYNNQIFPYSEIKQKKLNLYSIKNDLGEHNFCFRPRWYQLPKFLTYYYIRKLLQIMNIFI